MTNEFEGEALQRESHPISSEQVDAIFQALDELRQRVATLEAAAGVRPED